MHDCFFAPRNLVSKTTCSPPARSCALRDWAPRFRRRPAGVAEPDAAAAGWLPMSQKPESNLDRVWEIIEKVGVTMLTTRFSGGLRARPLEARPERDAGLI